MIYQQSYVKFINGGCPGQPDFLFYYVAYVSHDLINLKVQFFIVIVIVYSFLCYKSSMLISGYSPCDFLTILHYFKHFFVSSFSASVILSAFSFMIVIRTQASNAPDNQNKRNNQNYVRFVCGGVRRKAC